MRKQKIVLVTNSTTDLRCPSLKSSDDPRLSGSSVVLVYDICLVQLEFKKKKSVSLINTQYLKSIITHLFPTRLIISEYKYMRGVKQFIPCLVFGITN